MNSYLRRLGSSNLHKSLFLALLAGIVLVGCGSSQSVTVHDSTTITKGRELSDLQLARQEGALTEAEFERLRLVILKRNN